MIDVRTPRGTADILPEEARLWRRFEKTAAEVMRLFGFGEIRTPIFEQTELFIRGVGETSDIVEKQMYTFEDRGHRSLTLRPEGTAPVVRAFVQHRLHGQSLPAKLWYIQPMFRYERPQLGRGRQFHQFGAELIGSSDPACDVEIIAAGVEIYRRLGIADYEILLNSIGCTDCRPAYRNVLIDYLKARLDDLCTDCKNRYDRNPLRVLDCKVEGCGHVTKDAPTIGSHLCETCLDHFNVVKRLLEAAGIRFRLDERLVRGLDYYTKTVFEFVTTELGAQGTLLAGGRYDGLVESLGGPPLPAVGFGAGIERAVAMLQAAVGSNAVQAGKGESEEPDVFIVTLGENARVTGMQIAIQLRQLGVVVAVDYDHGSAERAFAFGKSMRAQMKSADRSNASVALIIGDDEVERGVAVVRKMDAADQSEIQLKDVARTVQHIIEGFIGEEVST